MRTGWVRFEPARSLKVGQIPTGADNQSHASRLRVPEPDFLSQGISISGLLPMPRAMPIWDNIHRLLER